MHFNEKWSEQNGALFSQTKPYSQAAVARTGGKVQGMKAFISPWSILDLPLPPYERNTASCCSFTPFEYDGLPVRAALLCIIMIPSLLIERLS